MLHQCIRYHLRHYISDIISILIKIIIIIHTPRCCFKFKRIIIEYNFSKS
jgi:hypothetical protein